MTTKKSELREWIEAIVIAVILAFIIKSFLIDTIQVDGKSMEPSLHHEDRLIISKITYHISPPETGDIIIFKYPGNTDDNYVKRVIGVAGDKVKVEDGVVYVNDKVLDEDYIAEKPIVGWEEDIVPPNSIFVLGDNRNNSKDSRDQSVGYVPSKNIIGKAWFRIWPIKDIKLFR